MPLNTSSGFFPSRSAVRAVERAVPRADFARMCWGTTTERHFYKKDLTEMDRGESMGEVYNVGQRSTKYMAFQPNTAPLLRRVACGYANEYSLRQSDEAKDNAEIAKMLKGPSRMRSLPSVGTKTLYTETFSVPSVEEMLLAKQPPSGFRQAPTHTTSGMDDEPASDTSHTQRHHGQLRSVPWARGKSRVDFHASSVSICSGSAPLYRSQYQRTFDPAETWAMSDLPPADNLECLSVPAHLVPSADGAVWGATRACHLAPGR